MYIHSPRNIHHKQVENRVSVSLKLRELKLKVEKSDRVL